MRRITRYISLITLVVLCSCNVSQHEIVGGRVSIAYLRSLLSDSSVPIVYDYTISGMVVANDCYGELSNAFVLADESGGIEVNVDFGSLPVEAVIPLYSYLELRCSGLCLGRVGRKVVLGVAPTEEYVVDRIDMSELTNRINLCYGDAYVLNPEPMAIADIDYEDMCRYVMLSDVSVVPEERGLSWCDSSLVTDNSISDDYITSVRHFTDGCNTIAFIISGESHYAAEQVPTTAQNCVGIVDSYNGDIAFRISGYQIESADK